MRKNKTTLTVPAHSHGDALLQPTVLAPIPVDPQYRALLVLSAWSVLDLLLDAPPEEALFGKTTVGISYTRCSTNGINYSSRSCNTVSTGRRHYRITTVAHTSHVTTEYLAR